MDDKLKERLRKLMDRRMEITASDRNQQNKRFWGEQPVPWCRDMIRRIPKGKGYEGIPFVVAPDNAIWSHVFNMDLQQYYSDPYTHLAQQLAIDIYKYEQFQDDTYFDNNLFIWFGVITELTFFGIKPVFFKEREGWIEETPVLEDKELLDGMQYPDFFKSGLMPLIHQYYEEMNELVQGKFKIMFPDWARGPFCMAAHMRGLQNILMDMIIDPGFVHKLMRFVTDSRKHWLLERAKFLNEPIQKGKLYNDEVDCPSLSPSMYKEFILPYESELSQFQAGITYWHSCGNTTAFFQDIDQIPNLEMFHVSPWSNLDKAVEVMGGRKVLDINLDPMKDIFEQDAKGMEERLHKIVTTCGSIPYSIRADAFQILNGVEKDIAKIKEWTEVARKVLS